MLAARKVVLKSIHLLVHCILYTVILSACYRTLVRDRETRKSVLSGKSPKRAVSNRPQSARSFNGAAETGYSRRPASARYSPVVSAALLYCYQTSSLS